MYCLCDGKKLEEDIRLKSFIEKGLVGSGKEKEKKVILKLKLLTYIFVRSQASIQVLQKRCMHTEIVRVSFRMPASSTKNRNFIRNLDRGERASIFSIRRKEHVPLQTGHRARSAISLSLTVTKLQREEKVEMDKLQIHRQTQGDSVFCCQHATRPKFRNFQIYYFTVDIYSPVVYMRLCTILTRRNARATSVLHFIWAQKCLGLSGEQGASRGPLGVIRRNAAQLKWSLWYSHHQRRVKWPRNSLYNPTPGSSSLCAEF